jgi:hypothetical protein
MANYDEPTNVYDGFLRYDAVATTIGKRMIARIAYNLRNLSSLQTLAKIKTAHDAILAHAVRFPTPNPTLVVLLAAYNAAKAKVEQEIMLEQQLLQVRTERVQCLDDAVEVYRNMGSYVENIASGNAAIIEEGGYDVVQAATGPQPMPKVENNSLTTGDDDGTGDGGWDSVTGGKSYEVQVSPDPITPTSWIHYVVTTTSKVHLTGQPSGQKRWMRVRAINKLGPGPWSDPACCIIP